MATLSREPRARALLLSLVLFFGLALPAPAATAPVADNNVSARRVMHWALGSQRRMLQVATIGMCFALWIMMKK